MRLRVLGAIGLFTGAILASPAAACDAPVHSARMSPQANRAAAVVDMFHAALNRGDTAGAKLLLAPEVLIYESGAAERSRDEYARHHLQADSEFSGAVPTRITRRTGSVACNLAWIASESRASGIFKGRPINSRTTETAILRRFGPSWRIIHIHWSSEKVAPPAN